MNTSDEREDADLEIHDTAPDDADGTESVDHDLIEDEQDAELLNSVNETIYTIRAAPNAARVRLDQFITRSVQNATRTKVQHLIEAGGVTVDGRVTTKPGRAVLPGEVVVCTVPKPPPPDIVAEDIPLDIIFEDDDVLVVNKPAAMVTHPAYGNYSGTLVNALMHHTAHLSLERGTERAGILHRLDKGTSGLLCVAKTSLAHHFLARQFADHTVDREYMALAWGTMPEDEGLIDLPLGRHRSDRKRMAVIDDGKPAVTGYKVERQYESFVLLRLRLRTGRTHQIRAHLAHLRHPLLGDPTYGGRRILYGAVTQRYKMFVAGLLDLLDHQALHARTLGFVHPVTRERVFFEAQPPADFREAIARLEDYYGGS